MPAKKPKIAVYKFASCDGCQLSLLDAEDELLLVAGAESRHKNNHDLANAQMRP